MRQKAWSATLSLVSMCKIVTLPCCSPHGSLLCLQSSFLSRGQVLVRGHSQLGALHTKSLLMSALCFGCTDWSRWFPGVHRDQTDEREEEKWWLRWWKRQHTDIQTWCSILSLPGHGVGPLLQPEAVLQWIPLRVSLSINRGGSTHRNNS